MKPYNWNRPEVKRILDNPDLTLSQMAERLGVSYFQASRKRKELECTRNLKVTGGYGHIATNKERKARYNAKHAKKHKLIIEIISVTGEPYNTFKLILDNEQYNELQRLRLETYSNEQALYRFSNSEKVSPHYHYKLRRLYKHGQAMVRITDKSKR